MDTIDSAASGDGPFAADTWLTMDRPTAGELLERWTRRGYLTAAQAELIRSGEALGAIPRQLGPPAWSESAAARVPAAVPAGVPAAAPAGVPAGLTAGQAVIASTTRAADPASLLAEGLGYVGALLMVIAATLLASQFWPGLDATARVGVMAASSIGLLAAGVGVPRSLGPAYSRVRSALWLASTAALAVALAELAGHGLGWTPHDTGLLVGGGCALYLVVLRRTAPSSLLQAALLLAVVTALVSFLGGFELTDDADVQSAAVWVVGMLWWALGGLGVLRPARTARLLGTATALAGSVAVAVSGWGLGIGAVTAGAFLVAALRTHDTLLLVLASVAVLDVVPRVADRWSSGSAAGPVTLLATGAVMLVAAVVTSRHRHRRQRPRTS